MLPVWGAHPTGDTGIDSRYSSTKSNFYTEEFMNLYRVTVTIEVAAPTEDLAVAAVMIAVGSDSLDVERVTEVVVLEPEPA